MGDGPFSTAGFLNSWNAGNEFGYSSMLRGERSAGNPIRTWPRARLEAAWWWNYSKQQAQASLGEDTFVPTLFLLALNGRPASVAVWPDAISEVIPEVDYLMIGREELAPKNLFGLKKKDGIIIPFDHCRELLFPYQTCGYSLPAYHVPPGETPPELLKFVRALRPSGIDGDGIPWDQILNEEVVQ